ncbi:putative oxalate decarboxylase oxdc protein [Phaeoacremonium minimum UCRPA7]|uniref:Putative oxalate decarboxylase oxdc protein n=1 Tax=Phaeoacremonium minimum (strain UCR-PA7) TaxID=1286976 RepID=R8B8Q6_PHAM7|nr:putative oxalate decarboxylase oxdc protein [Phaeoacremonium minimum UCRPA7]EON95690.1 putative oxalate decarboxylase oxdc protein [Phaeoacremonium minimum UCRPA7]
MYFTQLRNNAARLLVLVACFTELTLALPHRDSPRQRLLDGKELPSNLRPKKTDPYTPNFRDPYDHAVDPIADDLDPLPWRNGLGASVLGPWNKERSRQSPDLVRPPSTDHGNLPSLRWSFADSHIRIEEGGWTRQTTVRELPTSIELASVNMRLGEGVIRELHWHKEAEWAYVLDGKVRVTALDYEGGNFIDDLEKGDLWYFPSGVPHSLQGLSENGTEFLLVFDDGRFSEESTFILTDWLAHTPRSVISENFHLDPEIFAHLPKGEKYIFKGTNPGSIDDERPRGKNVKKSKYNFTHKMLAQEPTNTTGGQVRITDSKNFPISQTVAAAHAIIEPGAIREMHWHPNADEWSFFIRGRARVTVFAAEGNARTFNYVPGDVGIVPRNMGHFVENIGDEPLEMLEVFRADEFRDFSLFQWLGETPQRMVVDHLFADDKESGERFLREIKDAQKDPITKGSIREDDMTEDDEYDL